MSGGDTTRGSAPRGTDRFTDTHWSEVLAAGAGDPCRAALALEQLCRAYWYPLYVFVRRRGHDPHQAQDLTQGFFAQLLRRDSFRSLVPGRGRFRSFLLVALNRYLVDEHSRKQARKRGGNQILLSLDAPAAEGRYQIEPGHADSPERLFERRWATTLLDRTLERLEQEFLQNGKGRLFVELREYILEGTSGRTYAAAGAAIGLSEEAMKKAAQRMRRRYQEILRDEISRTVAMASEVEEELRHLWTVLKA